MIFPYRIPACSCVQCRPDGIQIPCRFHLNTLVRQEETGGGTGMKKIHLYHIATAELIVLCVLCIAILAVQLTSERRAAQAALQSVQDAVLEAYAAQTAGTVSDSTEGADTAAADGAGSAETGSTAESGGSSTIDAGTGTDSAAGADETAQATGSTAYETDVQAADFYLSPVDFDALQAINPEIYAWIYIPGTDINYPVLQSTTDDEWYLTHNADGETDSAGAIFSQASYNGTDFTDPVTVLYGHRRGDGTMFSQLQALYSADDGLETYSEIIIYLPDRELHYTPFAAVPYDSRHILYTYNFDNASMFTAFLSTISSVTESTAQFRAHTTISTDDNLLILSTCLYGNAQRRYLILAKEESDITATAALSVVG